MTYHNDESALIRALFDQKQANELRRLRADNAILTDTESAAVVNDYLDAKNKLTLAGFWGGR